MAHSYANNKVNAVRTNMGKFMNPGASNAPIKKESDPNIMASTKEWFAKNTDPDIQFVSTVDNRALISLNFDNIVHQVEISFPKGYPKNKKGYGVTEVSKNVVPLTFIPKLNAQLADKILTIEKILTHLANTFMKYKESNQKKNKILYDITPVDEMGIWNDMGAKTTTSSVAIIPSELDVRDATQTVAIIPSELDVRDLTQTVAIISSELETRTTSLSVTPNSSEFDVKDDTQSDVPNSNELEAKIIERILTSDSLNPPESTMEVNKMDMSEKILKIVQSNSALCDGITFEASSDSDMEEFGIIAHSVKSTEINKNTFEIEDIVTFIPKTQELNIPPISIKLEDMTDSDKDSDTSKEIGIDDMTPDEMKEVALHVQQIETIKYPTPISNSEECEKVILPTETTEDVLNSVRTDMPVVSPVLVETDCGTICTEEDASHADETSSNADGNSGNEADPVGEPNSVHHMLSVTPDSSESETYYYVEDSQSISSEDNSSSTSRSSRPVARLVEEEVLRRDQASYSESEVLTSEEVVRRTPEASRSIPESDSSEEVPKRKPIVKTKKAVAKKVVAKKIAPKKTEPKKEPEMQPKQNSIDKKSIPTPQIIRFDDVNDKLGFYLNLTSYVDKIIFPYDVDKLVSNALNNQNPMIIDKIAKINTNLKPNKLVQMLINEIKYLRKNHNFGIEIVDGNIYHLKFRFERTFFDSTSAIYSDLSDSLSVELEVKLEHGLYPFCPPLVLLTSPILKDNLGQAISQMAPLLTKNWGPTCNLEMMVNCFRDLMNESARIDFPFRAYSKLEKDLTKLAFLAGNPSGSIHPANKTPKENSKVPIRGTGYGYQGLASWDFQSASKTKEEIEKETLKCVKDITFQLTKMIMGSGSSQAVQIVINSYLVSYLNTVFGETNLLGLTKNLNRFNVHLDLLRIMNKDFYEIFCDANGKKLFETLSLMNADCVVYVKKIKAGDSNEHSTITNFINYFDKLEKLISNMKLSTEIEQNLKQFTQQKDLVAQRYETELKDELFKECLMTDNMFSPMVPSGDTLSSAPPKNTISRITKELITIQRSLPLHFESSVFYRVCPTNIKMHEFLVMGPENTPYDSGCFHFRLYCPSSYPQVGPKAKTCTTGNGNVKFNPNLYSNGNICLSLLGTYDGSVSERWIPSESSILQIIISIQALIFNSTPYFNEAGYELKRGSTYDEKESLKYNDKIRLECMKWAMINQMKNPVPGFEEAIRKHFIIKSEYIKMVCKQWVSQTTSHKKEYENTHRLLCEELDKLSGKKTLVKAPIKKTKDEDSDKPPCKGKAPAKKMAPTKKMTPAKKMPPMRKKAESETSGSEEDEVLSERSTGDKRALSTSDDGSEESQMLSVSEESPMPRTGPARAPITGRLVRTPPRRQSRTSESDSGSEDMPKPKMIKSSTSYPIRAPAKKMPAPKKGKVLAK
jgi:ubiquitin-protein ligase